MNKWIMLVCDPETNKWSVMAESYFQDPVTEQAEAMRESGDASPFIIISTADFVTV